MMLTWMILSRRWWIARPVFAIVSLILMFALSFGCNANRDPTVLHPEVATVTIITVGDDPGHVVQCRGFFVSADGLIATRLHLINPEGEMLVKPPGGPELKAKFVQKNKNADLAIIQVAGEHFPFLKLYQDDILPGMHVRLLGREGISHGAFDHWENSGQDMSFTSRIGLNDGGSPLLADDGRVIGIARGVSSDTSFDSDAKPIWDLLQMMPALGIPKL